MNAEMADWIERKLQKAARCCEDCLGKAEKEIAAVLAAEWEKEHPALLQPHWRKDGGP